MRSTGRTPARKPARPDRPPLDWPVYWFTALDQAIEFGDWAAAAEAQGQLERLGVTVRYRQPERQQPQEARRGT